MTTRTTSQRIYSITKYSAGRVTNNERSTGGEILKWEHLIDPSLELRLESVYSQNHEEEKEQVSPSLEHLWLEVSYLPKQQQTSNSYSQRHSHAPVRIILESLDLAAFSTAQIRRSTPHSHLPLRGVFRDTVVGLRYVYLPENEGTVEFRRFQIKFKTLAEVEAFKSAIAGWCPLEPADTASSKVSINSKKIPSSRPLPRLADTSKSPTRNSGRTATSSSLNSTAFSSPPLSPPNQTAVISSPEFGIRSSSPPTPRGRNMLPSSSPLRGLPSPPAPNTDPQKVSSSSMSHSSLRASTTIPLRSNGISPAHPATSLSLAKLFPHLIPAEHNSRSSNPPHHDLLSLDREEFTALLTKTVEEEDFPALMEKIRGIIADPA